MIVSLILAMDEGGGIARGGQIPWRLSRDLRRFKRVTMGHHLVVGRVTCETIGHPLPGRTMIVVTRQPDYQAEGCFVVNSLEQSLALAESRGESEVFIIGGGEIYAQSLALADRIYLTRVHTDAGCDVFFPEFKMDSWDEVHWEFHPADENNQHPFTIQLLERKTKVTNSA